MKLDELRRHLRSNLESEAQPTKDSFDEAELARICIACGTKLDAGDLDELTQLCRECAASCLECGAKLDDADDPFGGIRCRSCYAKRGACERCGYPRIDGFAACPFCTSF